MTETEWNLCTDPIAMLAFLQCTGQASDRQLRLFAVACSRRIWDLLDQLGQGAVAIAEDFADGLAGPDQLRVARLACRSMGAQSAWYAAASNPAVAARNAALSAQQATRIDRAECQVQVQLLRDIFPNPFRPPPRFDPAWLTSPGGEIEELARAIYEHRTLLGGGLDPGQLIILGQKMEEGGYRDAGLLNHLRSPHNHVRGCFALDCILRAN